MILKFLFGNREKSDPSSGYKDYAMRRQLGLGGISPPSLELKPGEKLPPPPSLLGEVVRKEAEEAK